MVYSGIPISRTYQNKWTLDKNCRKTNNRTLVITLYSLQQIKEHLAPFSHCVNSQTCLTIRDTGVMLSMEVLQFCSTVTKKSWKKTVLRPVAPRSPQPLRTVQHQWSLQHVMSPPGLNTTALVSRIVGHIEISEHWTPDKICRKTNSRTPVLHYIYCNK